MEGPYPEFTYNPVDGSVVIYLQPKTLGDFRDERYYKSYMKGFRKGKHVKRPKAPKSRLMIDCKWLDMARALKVASVCQRCKGNGGDPEDGDPDTGQHACRDCHGNGERCKIVDCWWPHQ